MTEQKTRVKEPLVRLVRRELDNRWVRWAIRGGSVVIALLLSCLFVYVISGMTMSQTVSELWNGAIGQGKGVPIRLGQTVLRTTQLLCVAVALAPAFKMKFWNIGAEGQVLVGATAAALFMDMFAQMPGEAGMPAPVIYVVMILGSILAGAAWGVIPAVFKAKWGTNETLFTLMMNYAATQLTLASVEVLKHGHNALGTFGGYGAGWMPKIGRYTYAIPVIVFLVLTVLMYFYMAKTKHGYEIAVVGESQNTARYAGINVKWVIIRTMLISGAICGLCGGLLVMGDTHTLNDTIGRGYGFTAIIVAWLAKFNPIAMIAVAFLVVFLENGTTAIGDSLTGAERGSAFSDGGDRILIGIVLFCILACEFFINYKLVFRKDSGIARLISRVSAIGSRGKGKEE